jgi:HK97 family phage portal protein
MGFIDRVASRATKTLERSADPVTMQEFGYLLGAQNGGGHTKSGVTMGPTKALTLPAWFSGVKYLSESVAFLPIHTYKDVVGGERKERANPPWVQKPDAETSWEALVEGWMMALLHRGNAYSFKIRNDMGQVVGLRPILPDRIKVTISPSGFKVFEIDNRKDVAFSSREILHIPGLSNNGVVGIDPITYHAETLGRLAAADQSASLHFGEGFNLKAYMQVPGTLTDEQLGDLGRAANDLYSGLQNVGRLGVIGNGAELKTLTLSPEQLELLESRKYGTIEVSQILRLPPHKLYNLERATFSNIEQQEIDAVGDGIRPWVNRIESRLKFDPDLNVRGNFQELNLDALMRGDLAGRYAAYAAGITGGFLMPSEPRHWERLPYIEGTEFLQRPLNMATVGPDAVADPSVMPTDPPADPPTNPSPGGTP